MTIASSSGLNDKDIERMIEDAEKYAEADKSRRQLIEEANKGESVCADTEKGRYLMAPCCLTITQTTLTAMNEFKDQLDAAEKDKVTKLVSELREMSSKGLVGDDSVTADQIREKISETQQASLGLFQKVYEKRSAENASSSDSTTQTSEEKKD